MRRRCVAWLDHVAANEAAILSGTSILGWLLGSAFVALIFFACAYVPAARDLVGLRVGPAVAAYLPLPALAVALNVAHPRMTRRTHTGLVALGSAVTGAFPALLVAFSAMPGSAVFAAFFLLTAVVHAQVLRAGTTFPFFGAAFVAQAGASLAFNHDEAHLLVWSLTAPAALIAGLVAGQYRLRDDEHHAQLANTRTALDAQILESSAETRRQLESRVEQLLGIHHDLKSPLSAALLGSEILLRKLQTGSPLGPDDVAGKVDEIRAALLRTRELFEATRQKAAEQRPAPLAVAGTIAPVVERTRQRFPEVTVDFDVPGDLKALVVAGAGTLERIVDNLVTNACEGDGARGATQVRCAARQEGDEILLVVEDDGPGFPAHLLAGPTEAFGTTKRTGTGLGLFTAERLARACGGGLRRENRTDHRGARVVVTLLPEGNAA